MARVEFVNGMQGFIGERRGDGTAEVGPTSGEESETLVREGVGEGAGDFALSSGLCARRR